MQEKTSISLYKFGSWFGSSTVLAIIETLTISSLVEKQSREKNRNLKKAYGKKKNLLRGSRSLRVMEGVSML